MIKIGTICYIVGEHYLTGECCTIIGPLALRLLERSKKEEFTYEIMPASGERAEPKYLGWAAYPHELIPITPPGQNQNTKTDRPIMETT